MKCCVVDITSIVLGWSGVTDLCRILMIRGMLSIMRRKSLVGKGDTIVYVLAWTCYIVDITSELLGWTGVGICVRC